MDGPGGFEIKGEHFAVADTLAIHLYNFERERGSDLQSVKCLKNSFLGLLSENSTYVTQRRKQSILKGHLHVTSYIVVQSVFCLTLKNPAPENYP